jgi:predicted GIY-YIG superfamily endonuclease
MSKNSLPYLVYILRSLPQNSRFYVGSTRELDQRLKIHNQRGSIHTAKFAPWELVWHAAFPTRSAAEKFEAYLKTGSGRAFAKRHLSPD